MRKLCILLVVLLFGVSAPAWADFLVVDVDIANGLTDSNATYWVGPDINNEIGNDQLLNANEVTEGTWLAALLGSTTPKVALDRDLFADPTPTSLDYNPGFRWTYAVVKWNGFWSAYQDDGDFRLEVPTVGAYRNGISHVTFFDGEGTPIPEPATMLLFGTGLVGLAGLGRRKLFKK